MKSIKYWEASCPSSSSNVYSLSLCVSISISLTLPISPVTNTTQYHHHQPLLFSLPKIAVMYWRWDFTTQSFSRTWVDKVVAKILVYKQKMWGFGGRFYWGRRERGEEVQGLVVIYAWMSSEEKHVKSYVDLYASLGWNSLVCHSQFLNMYVISCPYLSSLYRFYQVGWCSYLLFVIGDLWVLVCLTMTVIKRLPFCCWCVRTQFGLFLKLKFWWWVLCW